MNKKTSPYETIVVLVSACIVLYLFRPYREFLWFALTLSAVSVFFPAIAKKIHLAWFKLAEALGYIMGKVLFTVVYIFILLPLSVISRKKVSMELKRKEGSYFKERNHLYIKEDLDNVW